ncbi:MAG: hypothetical protein V7689_08400 [Psychrobacter sp.]
MNIQDTNLKFDCEKLGMYQIKQYEHDLLYHADIVALGMVRRLTHVALHLSKYAYGISLPRNTERFKKDYTDAFIMVVSASNILSMDLSASNILSMDSSEHEDSDEYLCDSFLSNYLYLSSIFSKSCESYDHFEEHTFHASWKESTYSLFKSFEKDSFERDIDLIRLANERLNNVETKITSTNIKYKIENKLKIVK